MSKDHKKNKILKLIGNLVVVLALAFIVKKLVDADVDYGQVVSGNSIYIYLLLISLYAFAVICMSIPWNNVVYLMTGEKIAFREVAEVSTRANVMKYIPGNVFQYIGRNSLAVNKGLKHSEVAISTLLDVIINLGVVFLLTLIFSFQTIMTWLQQYIKIWHIVVAVLGVLSVAIILFLIRGKIYEKFEDSLKRIFSKHGILTVLKNIAIYSVLSMITTAIYMIVLLMLEENLYTIDIWFAMIGAILASWILGFITPGAPGGLGVREAVLIMMLGGVVSEDTIILGVIVNRIISTIGDLLAMAIMMLVNRMLKESPSKDLPRQ